MLTKLTVRNFKRFGEIEVELGNPVVFIGPNNSGKTSALQAIALWHAGLSRWNERRKGKGTPEKRPGVTINRRDLVAVPIPDANLLWRNLHVRDVQKTEKGQITKNIRVDVIAEGVTNQTAWKCGLEFDYANEESFYCRPLRLSEEDRAARMIIPDEAGLVRVAFLPPMSGLASNETRLDQGAINVRVGEGKTAEVLRNLCYTISSQDEALWRDLVAHIRKLFGCELDPPVYVAERGELEMTYREKGVRLDLSSSGRGLQQTLLLLAYMFANQNAVLLLDEPDAHLEILRQRQIYQVLTEVARLKGNQVIAASHSEVLLNEAADRDVVVAFVGKPHRINDRGSQVLKALREIGFEDYYQAEQTGWVLYLEGSTDLAILQALASRMGHTEAVRVLERPFVRYVGNQPVDAMKHYHGLREAVSQLQAFALFDRLDAGLPPEMNFGRMWERREIENYLCLQSTLEAYARSRAASEAIGPLFGDAEEKRSLRAMREAISEVETALQTLGKGSPWGPDIKVSDDFLAPLFERFFRKLQMPNLMAKKNFHELANYVLPEELSPEIRDTLDLIVQTAHSATAGDGEN
jgi:ABC-type taurine transport system ATPase subunit